MKKIINHTLAVLLVLFGGTLLVIGLLEGQGLFMLLAAGLALVAGLVALLLQLGVVGRKAGFVLGIVFAAMALGLAYQNFRSAATTGTAHGQSSTNLDKGA
jgi:membrane protein implicated in regulation of membrane protease activity